MKICFLKLLAVAALAYVRFLPLPQVVGEVLLDVLYKVVRVFRVEVQHLVQPLQVDALQVTVGQRLDVGIGLYHALIQRHVCPDQVALTCSERHGSGLTVEVLQQYEVILNC